VLLRVRLISLEAANRAWMQGATYREAVTAGTVMAGGAIAEVVESKAPGFSAGDLVFADTGWQDYAALPGKRLVKVPKIEPMTRLLSVYGIAGLTGLLRPPQHRQSESRRDRRRVGAAGLRRLHRRPDRQDQGCRAVGIAGGQAKCEWLGQRSSASTPPSTTSRARCSRP
jgi:NADPH-dependent curcumin reductase CurA